MYFANHLTYTFYPNEKVPQGAVSKHDVMHLK